MENKTIYRMFSESDYNKVLFVMKLLSKKGGELYERVLKVEPTRTGSRLIALDKNRIYAVEIGAKVEPGFYQPQVTKDFVKFANPIPNVFYPTVKGLLDGNLKFSIDAKDYSTSSEMMAVLCKDLVTQVGEIIDIKYLNELPKEKKWDIYSHEGNHKPVVFKTKDYSLAFAPMAA